MNTIAADLGATHSGNAYMNMDVKTALHVFFGWLKKPNEKDSIKSLSEGVRNGTV